MTYKMKSALYFGCFLISALLYYEMDTHSDLQPEPVVVADLEIEDPEEELDEEVSE